MSEISAWHRKKPLESKDYHIFTASIDLWKKEKEDIYKPRTTLDCKDWTNVVAITPDKKIVFVKQFRFGIQDFTLELPGGVIEVGENSYTAVSRELKEETGYSSINWMYLRTVHPNPAFQNNIYPHYLALNAVKTADPCPDEDEEIEVVLLDKEQILEKIAFGDITHALTISALSNVLDIRKYKL